MTAREPGPIEAAAREQIKAAAEQFDHGRLKAAGFDAIVCAQDVYARAATADALLAIAAQVEQVAQAIRDHGVGRRPGPISDRPRDPDLSRYPNA